MEDVKQQVERIIGEELDSDEWTDFVVKDIEESLRGGKTTSEISKDVANLILIKRAAKNSRDPHLRRRFEREEDPRATAEGGKRDSSSRGETTGLKKVMETLVLSVVSGVKTPTQILAEAAFKMILMNLDKIPGVHWAVTRVKSFSCYVLDIYVTTARETSPSLCIAAGPIISLFLGMYFSFFLWLVPSLPSLPLWISALVIIVIFSIIPLIISLFLNPQGQKSA